MSATRRADGGPSRIVVCGTQYGVLYLDAVASLPGAQLCGIVARGSERARWLAAECDVPLFTTPAEVPPEVDLACVAVGGEAGDALARSFVDRGVHVLQEHPVSVSHLRDVLARASARGACFHVNHHFADLPAPAAFVAQVRAARSQAAPLFGVVVTSQRASCSALDVAGLALGAVDLGEITIASPGGPGPFVVRSALAGVPFALILQRAGDVDDGRDSVISHRITVTFPGGDVTLGGAFGPIVTSGDVPGAARTTRTWTTAGARAPARSAVLQMRVDANRDAIARLLRHAATGECPDPQRPEHLVDVADATARLLDALDGASR